jgi:hypothetical protein
MDTNHILKSTLTGESRQQKRDSRTCLFCGFSYFFKPIHTRYHLGLGRVSKKVQKCTPSEEHIECHYDTQTSSSGYRPISWEMHQQMEWIEPFFRDCFDKCGDQVCVTCFNDGSVSRYILLCATLCNFPVSLLN